MATVETAESGHALRGVCLLAVLLTARVLVVAGRTVPLSVWSPFAYLWQDVLVAALFVVIDARLKRPRIAWTIYATLVLYIALNVPVARVLSTPLTFTLFRAAGGPLADAVLHYVTVVNLAALALPLAVGAALPHLLHARVRRLNGAGVVTALLVVAIGPFATSRIETGGLHRNAVGALVETSVTRVAAKEAFVDWRATLDSGADLNSFRGSMRGRNVVLVALESTGARHLGLYGSVPDPAPNLSSLAQRSSIVFDRAYAVYPESIKGLFATLCSQYPAFDTAPEIYAGVPCASLAARLAAAGYRTALFHSGRFMYLGMMSVINHRGFEVMEDAGAIGGRADSSFGIDDESTVARALTWIDSVVGRAPFFVTYLPTSGHNPYVTTAPGPFRADSDFWRYMNALHESDAAFGTLIEGLRQRHLLENTLFVVFGDHGEAFGEHPGNFAHTLFIHEENVRIPLVIAAPGSAHATMRVSRVASVIDIAPTILDLVGLPLDALHQGASLLPADSRMALFYTDYSIGWLGLVDGCSKYLFDVDSGRSRLFDVCADPGETQDLAALDPIRITAYRDRIVGWASAQKARIEHRQ